MPITSSKVPVDGQVSNITLTSKNRVKLCGIYVDNRSNFDLHVSQLCKKTSKKLHAFSRIFMCEDTKKRRCFVNSSTKFSCCTFNVS